MAQIAEIPDSLANSRSNVPDAYKKTIG